MLMEAVEGGKPLTAEAVAKWLGAPRPPAVRQSEGPRPETRAGLPD
jgi:hypothetical protein